MRSRPESVRHSAIKDWAIGEFSGKIKERMSEVAESEKDERNAG